MAPDVGCDFAELLFYARGKICRSYMESSLPLLSPAQLGQQLHWLGGDLLLEGVTPPLQAA